MSEKTGCCFFEKAMGAFFTPSEEHGVKRAQRSGATLIPCSSDGTLCAAIALADQCSCKFAAKNIAFFLFTIWVGPFEVAEMGQK